MVMPKTSQTAQQGYRPRNTGPGGTYQGGGITNPQWQDNAIQYLQEQWVLNKSLPEGWDYTKYGTPDFNDYVDKTTGKAWISPSTITAFASYTKNYQPGTDRNLEVRLPYVPPQPNDYEETPETTAARIAQEQWDKNYGLNKQQQDYLDKKLSQDLGISEQQLVNARLQTAGNLAVQQAQLKQQQQDNIVQAQANPGRFVEAEYAKRGMNAPVGTTPLSNGSDTIGEIIKRLIEYAPGTGAPQSNGQPSIDLEEDMRLYPEKYGGRAFTSRPSLSTVVTPTVSGPTAAGVPPSPVSSSAPQTSFSPAQQSAIQTETNAMGAQAFSGQSPPLSGFKESYGDFSKMAEGGGTKESTYIAGDPQQDGEPNPELIMIDYGKRKSMVMPLSKAMSMHMDKSKYAYGTPGDYDSVDTWAKYQQDQNTPPIKTIAPIGQASTDPNLSHALGTPTALELTGGFNKGTIAGGPQSPEEVIAGTNAALANKPALSSVATGTGFSLGPQYPDSAYQNLPSLAYAQGKLSSGEYNTLNTGTSKGAFDTLLPEAGAMNYRALSDILNDPMAVQLMTSLYKSASRDFNSEVLRARSRAPIGQSLSSSLIRTR